VLLLGEGSWRPGREVESPAEGEGRSTKGEGGGGGRSTESDSKSRKSDSKSRKVPIQNLRRAILSFFLFSPGRKYSPNVLYICTEGVPERSGAPSGADVAVATQLRRKDDGVDGGAAVPIGPSP
jgi:hypothetical protein